MAAVALNDDGEGLFRRFRLLGLLGTAANTAVPRLLRQQHYCHAHSPARHGQDKENRLGVTGMH